jgi:hypothetical protein
LLEEAKRCLKQTHIYTTRKKERKKERMNERQKREGFDIGNK